MKKLRLLLSSIFLSIITSVDAQISFEQQSAPLPASQMIAPFYPSEWPHIKFADIDNDNDMDMFQVGIQNNEKISALFRNDGSGKFTEIKDSGLPLALSFDFVDIDGDDDIDIFFSGGFGFSSARIYLNDGSGLFTLAEETGIDELDDNGDSMFLDIDNDNDQDLIIIGTYYASPDTYNTCKLFTNDGLGNFTEVEGTSFNTLLDSSLAHADIDDDGDEDIIATGRSGATYYTHLYENDGFGNYTEVENTSIDGVTEAAVKFSDMDGDNDFDLFISGIGNESPAYTAIYENDGSGVFTKVVNQLFLQINSSTIDFIDYNNDDILDLFLTGSALGVGQVAIVYENDGNGGYTEVEDTPFVPMYSASINVVDVNGDNKDELLQVGNTSFFYDKDIWFFDNLDGAFVSVDEAFKGVHKSDIDYADIDGDGDIDIIYTGVSSSSGITCVYKNMGDGKFEYITDSGIPNLNINATVTLGDVDGDDDPDLMVSGSVVGQGVVTRLYENDGDGNFIHVTEEVFTTLYRGSIAFADIDNDDDLDLLTTGKYGSTLYSILYENDGTGHFVEMEEEDIQGMYANTVAFVDLDSDEDLDLIISGKKNEGSVIGTSSVTRLYFNNGDGHFTLNTASVINSSSNGDFALADIDDDDDLDLVIGGHETGDNVAMYRNNGEGLFSYINDIPFPALYWPSYDFADVDGDGDPDLYMQGSNYYEGLLSKIFLNDGIGNFSELEGFSFDDINTGTAAFKDFDGDDDPDLFITGCDIYDNKIARLYSNTTCISYGLDYINACETYTWIDGITYTQTNKNATFVIENGAANGCDSIAQLKLTIYSNPGPFTVYQDGNTLTAIPLAGSTGGLYQWLDCNNDMEEIPFANDLTFNPEVSGDYAVRRTKSGGCFIISDCYNVTLLGLDENSLENQITIYPNPAKDHLKLTFDHLGNYQLSIKNIIGKVLFEQQNMNQASYNIPLTNYSKGVYFVTISNGEEEFIKKLIIE